MAVQQFDIGGAETHVLELSRELTKRGHCVTVVSSGGELEKALASAGIKHVYAPMSSKDPKSVLEARRIVRGLIESGKTDVVHAHARIPAFICAPVCEKKRVRFVVTCHGAYKVTRLWKKLSDWGMKTLAVSDDIKQYLLDSYDVYPENISVTVNGIDTELFSPSVSANGIISELSLPPSAHRIVSVGRTDESAAAMQLLLAQSVPAIVGRYPDAQVIITGGGSIAGERDELPRLREMAEKYEKQYGRRVLYVTGPRTDIPQIVASCSLFIGLSRAALEAMAEEKPVILGGSPGYIGIIDNNNAAAAARTNFTCRGCQAASADRLLDDIERVYSLDEDVRTALSMAGRRLVLGEYSAEKTADDALRAYASVTLPAKSPDILISGYYGFDNTGDDSLLSAMLEAFRRTVPDAGLCVLAAHPHRLSRRYGVRAVQRMNVFSIIREMRHARLLISGGGNLLQNSTSNKSLLYYTAVIGLAKKMGLKAMVYAGGIGPLCTPAAEKRVCRCLEKLDAVSLRESSSLRLVSKLAPHVTCAYQSADPALAHSAADDERVSYIFSHAGASHGGRYYAVSLREQRSIRGSSGKEGEEVFAKLISRALRTIDEKYGMSPLFIPLQTSRDLGICERVMELTGDGGICVKGLGASEIIGVLGRCRFIIGMRLHSLIYALRAGIPMIGLSYDPKIDAFTAISGSDYTVEADTGFEPDKLVCYADIVMSSAEKIRADEKEALRGMQALLEKDALTVKKLLSD